MSEIIFCRTRHTYTSYTDYWRLVELSGFKQIFVDEIPHEGVKDNVYIVTPLNGEWENGIQTDAKVIWWDIEWRLGSDYPRPPGVTETWVSDRWYAQQTNTRYVPMGSHPDLCPAMTPKQDIYDVAFIGYFDGVPRRQVIRRQLIERGVKVSPTGAWGAERHALLRNSAAFLHVHQLERAPTIAPLRMVLAAAYALPVITERCNDNGVFGELMYKPEYDRIPEFVPYLVHATHEHLMDFGIALHQFLCYDLTFRKSVEAAL